MVRPPLAVWFKTAGEWIAAFHFGRFFLDIVRNLAVVHGLTPCFLLVKQT